MPSLRAGAHNAQFLSHVAQVNGPLSSWAWFRGSKHHDMATVYSAALSRAAEKNSRGARVTRVDHNMIS